MSLAFQNSESVKQALLEELQNLLSSEASVRQSAEGRIKQLEYTDGYGVYLSELIMNQSIELPIRQIACIMLTHYVEKYWSKVGDESESHVCMVSETAKRTIRNILPNGLYDPNSKIRSSVAHAISTIAVTDWPTVWTELFDIVIKCLGGNEHSIHGALLILQDFGYDELHIKTLGPVVVAEVYRIFESDQLYSLNTRTSAIRILKPLLLAIEMQIKNREEQKKMIDSILSNFMEKIVYYLSMNSGDASGFALRTEIMKLLTTLISDLHKYLIPYMDKILPTIWQLLTQVADVYVKVIANESERSPFPQANGDGEDELTNFTNMLIQIFEFIQTVIASPDFRPTIKNVLTDLLYITILYIQLSEEQILVWIDDPEKFVNDEEDCGGELTIRMQGKEVLITLSSEMGTKILPSLQEALGRHLNVAEAEKSNGNPNWWKIQEACMTAVQSCQKSVLPDSKFDLPNYLTIVLNLLRHPEAVHLVGRALITLSTFSKSDHYNAQMLEEMLNITLQSLARENSILLKLSAVMAIDSFVQAHEDTDNDKRAIIRAKLPALTEGILDITPESKGAVVGTLLESLCTILKFDSSFAATVQAKIIPLVIAVFLKYSDDPYTLETVQELIKTLCQNPACRNLLQEKFIPTIVSILSLQGEQANSANQDNAMDVLTTIVHYSQAPLSEALIENAFPAMMQCALRSDDYSVMASGGECLRSFVFVSPDQICNYKNGLGVSYIMELTTALLNPMGNEMTAAQIGTLVITVINKVGNLLGENIDLLLKAVISKMQLVTALKVMMSLVVIFAHLFITQMEAVLNFLSTVPGPTGEPAMQFVLHNWLSKQLFFYGAYERKVTTMALCKLFEYGITTKDSRLTSMTIKEQYVPEPSGDNLQRTRTRSQASAVQYIDIPVLVKIFKLLLNEYCHIREAKMAIYETESDGEEGEDSERPAGYCYVSDLYFKDEDEDYNDDDQLTQELLQNPLFSNFESKLGKFLRDFSTSEHFAMFSNHLTDYEKFLLETIQEDAEYKPNQL